MSASHNNNAVDQEFPAQSIPMSHWSRYVMLLLRQPSACDIRLLPHKCSETFCFVLNTIRTTICFSSDISGDSLCRTTRT